MLQSSRSPPVGSYEILSIRTQFKDIKVISWTQFNITDYIIHIMLSWYSDNAQRLMIIIIQIIHI